MKPLLIINGHDYARFVEELSLSRNDLDAEGSGRDVASGLMYRTRVAVKLKADVKLLRLPESVHRQLLEDISGQYFDAALLDPRTGQRAEKTFYVATVPFGAQRYDKHTGAPYYDGMAFSMTER